MSSAAVIAGMTATVVATIALAGYSSRVARTTGDFYVAARSVPAWWNASAISGEYLSAASFLGVAGLIMVGGADAVWFPVGYAVGYVLLLALVAAPLRRSGAYTLPDFCEARLRSSTVRLAASVLVVVIGWLYVVPQLQGAGLALQTILGTPIWLGGVLVALTVLVVIVGGGMRSVTMVQGFQYWLKLVAIMVPALFLLAAWRLDGGPSALVDEVPSFPEATAVSVGTDIVITVVEPVTVRADGTIDGSPVTAGWTSLAGTHSIDPGTTITFPAGAAVPHLATTPATTGTDWGQPLQGGQSHPMYRTYALMIALFLGTMGLPHVLVRFYTNPDGRQARRTALIVIGLVGLFYLSPSVYGMLGRVYTPELLMTGQTDAVVLLLPQALVGGTLGQALTALVCAGAAAAFLATATGLTVTVAGVLSQDVVSRWVHDPITVVPRRRGGSRARPPGPQPAGQRPAPGAGGRAGVHRGRRDVLPAAAAGHLVAAADRRRGRRRARARRDSGGRRDHGVDSDAGPHGLARRPAVAAGRVGDAAGAGDDGARVDGRPAIGCTRASTGS